MLFNRTEFQPPTPKIPPKDIFLIFFLSLFVGFGTYILGQFVLQDFPNSADEYAFLYQAKLFAEGRIGVPAHPQQEFLNPFHVITHQNRVFSIYPPGWPLLLSLGVRAGIPGLINPLIGATTVPILFYLGWKLLGRIYAWLSIFLLIFSPFFWFNSASYFSHASCLLAVLLTSIYLVHSTNIEKSIGNKKKILHFLYPYLAGFFFSYTYIIREMTSLVLLSAPVLFAALSSAILAGNSSTAINPISSQKKLFFNRLFNWPFIFFFLTGAAPLLIGYLCYNAELTGRWFFPPRYLLHDEYVGFGSREYRLFDYVETRYFSPWDGLRNTLRNIGRHLIWTFPGTPILTLWGVICVGKQNRNRWISIFALSSLLLPTAYFFYHSDGDNQYGPRYFYESLGYLVLPASVGIVHGLQKYPIQQNKIKGVCLGIILFLLAVLSFWYPTGYFYHQIYQRRTLYRLVEHQALREAIVFVGAPSGDMTQGDLIRNSPHPEKADVIYAWDLARRNRELLPYFPQRNGFRFIEDPQSGTYFLQPLSPRLGDR